MPDRGPYNCKAVVQTPAGPAPVPFDCEHCGDAACYWVAERWLCGACHYAAASRSLIVSAADCTECPDCGELVCPRCQEHYADCPCPGPHSEIA